MNENLHPALVEAYAIAPADVIHLHTLELWHPNMSEPLYLVQGYFHKEFRLKPDGPLIPFRACAFNFTLPATDDGGLQELTLTIDNANNRVSDFCESAMDNFPAPVTVFYRPFLSTDLETPLMNPPLRLFIRHADISEAQVTARAAPADFLNMKFPTEIYSSPRFPTV